MIGQKHQPQYLELNPVSQITCSLRTMNMAMPIMKKKKEAELAGKSHYHKLTSFVTIEAVQVKSINVRLCVTMEAVQVKSMNVRLPLSVHARSCIHFQEQELVIIQRWGLSVCTIPQVTITKDPSYKMEDSVHCICMPNNCWAFRDCLIVIVQNLLLQSSNCQSLCNFPSMLGPN